MVVHFLENNGGNKHATAKEFNIQPKQVCDQNNNKTKLLNFTQANLLNIQVQKMTYLNGFVQKEKIKMLLSKK